MYSQGLYILSQNCYKTGMTRFPLLTALGVIATLTTGPVSAKSPVAEVLCEPTSAMETRLKGRFGSARAATGIRDPEQIMELWTDRHGNWTMVVSYATGTSCIVAMGEDWVVLDRRDPA